MKPVSLFFVFSLLVVSARAVDPLEAARHYLDEHRVYRHPVVIPDNYASMQAKVAASRDPETKFGPYIWGLASSNAQVLTPDQTSALQALIAERSAHPVNWHDVRNIVRVQSLMTMWAYAGATGPTRIRALQDEWNAWNEMRLAYMFQEFVARERFQRNAWAILTPSQQKHLIAGTYDSLIKKNLGHGRAFSAVKQVTKALGKPQNQIAFDQVAATWERKWESIYALNDSAAKFDRQREFAMELADETFALASAKEAEKAFNAFTTAERDAIRDLVQAGYALNAGLDKKLNEVQNVLRSKMLEYHREHGNELLRRMGE